MRASLLVSSAFCAIGLLTAAGATTVTIDAEKNDCPIDMGQKAVPVKLGPGQWVIHVKGDLFYGSTNEITEAPCQEVLLNTDPSAVRSGGLPVAMLRIGWDGGVEVRRTTTAYLFLADRSTKDNSGSVAVTFSPRFDSSPVKSYRVDAVKNCYELDLDRRAVVLNLQPGIYDVCLKRSTLEYADRAVPLEEQPDQVVIDCNQARVGEACEGGQSLGTIVLATIGDSAHISVSEATTVRLYFAHSRARTYRGKLSVTVCSGGDMWD
ncbi:MAG: hypothetical protein HYU66_22805 [Armatimonadetes bacterium]|nr:hypothetical protein [Armatimonadota bacterium]